MKAGNGWSHPVHNGEARVLRAVTLVCAMLVAVTASAAGWLPYTADGETKPKDMNNPRKGYDRIVLSVAATPSAGYVRASDAIRLTTADVTAPGVTLTSILRRTYGSGTCPWENGTAEISELVGWHDAVKAALVPDLLSERGFDGIVTRSTGVNGDIQIHGVLVFLNEQNVKESIKKAVEGNKGSGTESVPESSVLTENAWILGYIPSEALSSGKLSLEAGVQAGQDHATGTVFALRAPFGGSVLESEDDPGAWPATLHIPAYCTIVRYHYGDAAAQPTKDHPDLFAISLHNDGWQPPQVALDRRWGIMGGYMTHPSSFVPALSYGINHYMRLFVGPSFGGDRHGQVVGGLTINVTNTAPSLVAAATASKTPATNTATNTASSTTTPPALNKSPEEAIPGPGGAPGGRPSPRPTLVGGQILLTGRAFASKDNGTTWEVGASVQIIVLDDKGNVLDTTTTDDQGTFQCAVRAPLAAKFAVEATLKGYKRDTTSFGGTDLPAVTLKLVKAP